MYTCVSDEIYVCVYVCIRVYARIMYVYTCMWVCTHVSMCTCVYVCMWLCVVAFQTHSCDPNSVIRDLNLCLLWTRFTWNSKTSQWDDSEICASLCSEDRKAIQIQNSVISCECLLLSYFHIYHSQYVFLFYIYHFMW